MPPSTSTVATDSSEDSASYVSASPSGSSKAADRSISSALPARSVGLAISAAVSGARFAPPPLAELPPPWSSSSWSSPPEPLPPPPEPLPPPPPAVAVADPRAAVGGFWVSSSRSSSRIMMRTDDGLPAVTSDGSAPSATVNVSSSVSASWFVVIVPVPLVAPEPIAMLVSVPWSSGSAELPVIVTGIVTLLDSAPDSVAVTVTLESLGHRIRRCRQPHLGDRRGGVRRAPRLLPETLAYGVLRAHAHPVARAVLEPRDRLRGRRAAAAHRHPAGRRVVARRRRAVGDCHARGRGVVHVVARRVREARRPRHHQLAPARGDRQIPRRARHVLPMARDGDRVGPLGGALFRRRRLHLDDVRADAQRDRIARRPARQRLRCRALLARR